MREQGTRVRWSFAVVAVATAVLLALPFVAHGGAVRLQDRHSDPSPAIEIETVAVTQAGKLYHDPRCRFIHGSPALEPAGVAVSRGLSPCPRCLGREPTFRSGSRLVDSRGREPLFIPALD